MDAARHYDIKACEATDGNRTDMQTFHNFVKRTLLSKYAANASRILDLAVGRGGDLHKWRSLGIQHALGIDISGESLCEAERRYTKMGRPYRYEFMQHDLRTGFAHHKYIGSCDAVTCMFALHYFFESEKTAHTIMHVAATHLKPGGYFIGVVPDACQVNERIKHGLYNDGFMKIQALWSDTPRCFGSQYTCSIIGTVTEDSSAPENLVYASVLQPLAALYNLHPIKLDLPCLEASTTCLHRLKPPYGPPFKVATQLYSAFVFQKRSSA